MPKLSIVIPVYNEKDLILGIMQKVKEVNLENTDIELIVVDDYSTDGTREILKEHGLEYADKILYHDTNQGKGAALKTGFKEITGDVAIVQDADYEYNPMEIPCVVKPIFDGDVDVCYGSRYLNSTYTGYLANRFANKTLTYFSNIITGLNVTDMETCYKAFRADFIKNIDIKEKRFGFEPEITAKVAHANLKLKEVPISYSPRSIQEGKKIRFKDGLRALYCIAKYR